MLKEKYRVKEIGIFGSYIRGEETKKSDLDIFVELEKNAEMGLLGFVQLENYLSDALGLKIDLVLKSTLKTYFKRG